MGALIFVELKETRTGMTVRVSAATVKSDVLVLGAAIVQSLDIALSWAATNTGMYDDLCLSVFGSWPATITMKVLAFSLLYALTRDQKSNWMRIPVGIVLLLSIGAFTHNLILLARTHHFLS